MFLLLICLVTFPHLAVFASVARRTASTHARGNHDSALVTRQGGAPECEIPHCFTPLSWHCVHHSKAMPSMMEDYKGLSCPRAIGGAVRATYEIQISVNVVFFLTVGAPIGPIQDLTIGRWGTLGETKRETERGVGMDLDLVTDMTGAGDGARSGVRGLGLGQVCHVGGVSAGLLLGAGAGASARRGTGHDEVMDLGEPSLVTSLEGPAGQQRAADDIRRRQAKAAKHTAKRNTRRKRDGVRLIHAYAPHTASSRRDAACETPPAMILHTHTSLFWPMIGLIHGAIITVVE
jgi:hypothetical protein